VRDDLNSASGPGAAEGLGAVPAEAWVDGWESRLAARAVEVGEFARGAAGLTGRGRSRDELVEVDVDASGQLVGVRMGEGIRSRPASATAAGVLEALGAARADLAAAVTALAQRAGGDAAGSVAAAWTQRLLSPDGGAGAAGGPSGEAARAEAEALSAHAARVGQVGAAVAEAGAAGRTTSLGTGAYGMLCSWFPPLMSQLQQVLASGVTDAAAGLADTADRLRTTVATYEETDSSAAELLRAAGQPR
jgi:hypothetical protein